MPFFIVTVLVLTALNLPAAVAGASRTKTIVLKNNCEILLSEDTDSEDWDRNYPHVFYSENGKRAVFQTPGRNYLHRYTMHDLETGDIIGYGADRPHDRYQSAVVDDYGNLAAFLQSEFEDNAWNERLSILDFGTKTKKIIDLAQIKMKPTLAEKVFKVAYGPSRFSDLTLNHPYLLRRRSGSKNSFLSQAAVNYSEIINWKTMQGFRLEDVSDNLEEVVPGLNVIHPGFQFAAIPSKDLKTVNIIPQEDLIRKTRDTRDMDPADKYLFKAIDKMERRIKRDKRHEQEYRYGLKHANPIRRMAFVRWAPYVFTQTADGVAIWNAREATLVGSIPDAHAGFEVLARMRVVAYELPGNKLGLYSVRQRKTVHIIENFPGLGNGAIDHWQDYVAYITNNDGEIFRLEENDNKKSATYSLQKLGIQKPLGGQLATIDVKNQTYLVIVFPDVSSAQVTMTAYSMATKMKVFEKVYAFNGLDGGSVFDPHRRRMLYTPNDSEAQLLDLTKTLGSATLVQIRK